MDLRLETTYIRETLINIWTDFGGKAASSRLKRQYPAVFNILSSMYSFTDNIAIKAWLFVNNESNVPVCYCGNNLKWLSFSRGFTRYCSTKCLSNSPEIKHKRQHTMQHLYGVDHYSKTVRYKSKFRNTMIKKYGVINPGQIEHKKLSRAKQKSLTYISKLIDDISPNYQPNFSLTEFNGVHCPSEWKCKKCNNIFVQPNLVGLTPRCYQCDPKPKLVGESKQELQIRGWIRDMLPDINISIKDRSILNGKELDIYIPEKNLAIEICGSYWHSDRFVSRNYHKQKFINCEQSGIHLITLFDFDLNKSDIIHQMLKSNLGLASNRLHARKCIIKEIDSVDSKQFLEKNHIRGSAAASHHFGLFYNDDLQAVATFRNARFKNKKSHLEIIRACTKTPVTGFLGKITKHVLTHLKPEALISYVDLRYGTGISYRNCNFVQTKETSPGYWYVSNEGCFHRSSFTKLNLAKQFGKDFVQNQTEFEIMDNLGYHRIWDCGHRMFMRGNDYV